MRWKTMHDVAYNNKTLLLYKLIKRKGFQGKLNLAPSYESQDIKFNTLLWLRPNWLLFSTMNSELTSL